jgi:hypothetical protein
MQVKSLGLAAICAVVTALPVAAHHSHGNYRQDFIDLVGVVKEVHLVNPHSWVYAEVKDAQGQTALWALEATGRAGLARIGVVSGYVSPGDTIKVRCHQLRDGSNGCLMGFLQARDGTIKDWDGGKAEPVDDGFFDKKPAE